MKYLLFLLFLTSTSSIFAYVRKDPRVFLQNDCLKYNEKEICIDIFEIKKNGFNQSISEAIRNELRDGGTRLFSEGLVVGVTDNYDKALDYSVKLKGSLKETTNIQVIKAKNKFFVILGPLCVFSNRNQLTRIKSKILEELINAPEKTSKTNALQQLELIKSVYNSLVVNFFKIMNTR